MATPARLRGGDLGEGRDAGRHDDEVRLAHARRGVIPRDEHDAQRLERERIGRQRVTPFAFVRDDAGAQPTAEPGRRDPARAESHHDNPLAREVGHVCPQRNFKLERLKSAKRMEIIQKRTMIFGSGQPFFSK